MREKFAIRAQKRKIFKISALFEKDSYLLVSEWVSERVSEKGKTNTGLKMKEEPLKKVELMEKNLNDFSE